MKNIGEVVCAIIEQGNAFLIAQRPPDHSLAGKWEFPGGKVRHGEAVVEALKREIQEELKIKIEVHDSLPRNTHAYEDISLTLIPFRCTIIAGNPTITEHQDIAWVDADSIGKYEMSGADIPILQDYLSTRRVR